MEKHALKLECLDINQEYADSIIETIREFMLNDIGFCEERIEPLECRSRDGFSPFSYNMGGLEAVAYQDQCHAYFEQTGFENADETLERYHKYTIEYFIESDKNKHLKYDQSNWTEEDLERFYEYWQEGEDSVLYGLDVMLNSESELNLRFTVCVKDSPYHRHYDDMFEYCLKFKSIESLKSLLEHVKKDNQVNRFKSLVENAY